MVEKILLESYTDFEALEKDLEKIHTDFIFSVDTPFDCRVIISKDEVKAIFHTKDDQRFERVFIDEDIEELYLVLKKKVSITRIIHLSTNGRPDYWN